VDAFGIFSLDLPTKEERTFISCSILICQPGKPDILTLFPQIQIISGHKIQRHDAYSVRIEAVLLALRNSPIPIENPVMAQIIRGTLPIPKSITVSTSRLPNFLDKGYRVPCSGYHFLGYLSHINHRVDNNIAESSAEYSSGELISSLSTAGAAEFFRVHQPMDVIPESHFIIIFTLPPIIATMPLERSFSASSITSESSLLSMDSDFNFSPETTGFYEELCRNTMQPDPQSLAAPIVDVPQSSPPPSLPSGSPQPSLSPSLHHPLSNSGATHSSPPFSLSGSTRPSPYRSPHHGQSNTIESILLILPTLSPPEDASLYHNAKYTPKIALVKMIRERQAIGHLLDILDLDATTSRLNVTNTYSDAAQNTYELTSGSVLKACGWKPGTFQNKGSGYKKAEKVAKMVWRGSVPNGLSPIISVLASCLINPHRSNQYTWAGEL
jgi:hypothetical protein